MFGQNTIPSPAPGVACLRVLVIPIRHLAVGTLLVVWSALSWAGSLDPLTEAERVLAAERARQALMAMSGTGIDADPSDKIQVLIAELHVPLGKSPVSGRLADVTLYDYRDNRVVIAQIDLTLGQVTSIQSQVGQQPALNTVEIAKARAIALANQPVVERLVSEHHRVTDQNPADPALVESNALVFTRIFAPDQVNAEANRCGKHRCAQITYFAGDDVALDLLVVVDLSRQQVAQILSFHSASLTR